jgi:hypothetical protein
MKPAFQLVVVVCLCVLSGRTAAAQPRHFWQSGRFWIPFALDTAAMFADYETSQQAFARGSHEMNPVFGTPRPSLGRMISIGEPGSFLYSYIGYRGSYSKHRAIRDMAYLPVIVDAGFHGFLAYQNTEVCISPLGTAMPGCCSAKNQGPVLH